MATGGMTASAPEIEMPTIVEEPTVASQGFETVEIMRELQKHGCFISEFKRTNSIHWKQLHLMCSAPLPLPGE